MFLFSELFWVLIITIAFLMPFSFIFLRLINRGDLLKKVEFYFITLIALIVISYFCEQTYIQIFNNSDFILIADIELTIIIILFSILYFILQKDFRSNYIIYIHSAITILSSHLIFNAFNGPILIGTIMITLIGLLDFAIIIPYDKEYKVIVTTVIVSLFMYISIVFQELILALSMLVVISFIVLMSNESFRNRIVSIYQTSVISLKRVGSWFKIRIKNKNYDNESPEYKNTVKNKKKKRILFWQARVKLLQGTLKHERSKIEKSEQEEKTWLRDFFSNQSRYGLELVSHKDFNWTFFIKSRSESKARVKGEALLTRLLSIFTGMDGELEVIPITRDKMLINNHFWEIKLPKPPYLEKFTLINDSITVFHRNKQEIKLYIMWKKASFKKIENIRRNIRKMKFKDDDEKKQYMKMWEEELFKVRIFASYHVMEENPLEKELELQRIEGRLRSLTMSCRNLKKAARLRRLVSGTQGNILRVNLFSGSYITPNCVDFDIPEFVPLVKPFVLENENFKYIPKEITDPNYVLLGRHINIGMLSFNIMR